MSIIDMNNRVAQNVALRKSRRSYYRNKSKSSRKEQVKSNTETKMNADAPIVNPELVKVLRKEKFQSFVFKAFCTLIIASILFFVGYYIFGVVQYYYFY